MENKVHSVNYWDEARLHYMKKIKGEMIERVEKLHSHGAEADILRDIIQFLDNIIYDVEEVLKATKKTSREQREVKRSRYDNL